MMILNAEPAQSLLLQQHGIFYMLSKRWIVVG